MAETKGQRGCEWIEVLWLWIVPYPVLMWTRDLYIENSLDLNQGCDHTPITSSSLIHIQKLEVYSSIWSLFRWDHCFRVTRVWSIKHSSTAYIIKDETVVIVFSARITHPFTVLFLSIFVVLFSSLQKMEQSLLRGESSGLGSRRRGLFRRSDAITHGSNYEKAAALIDLVRVTLSLFRSCVVRKSISGNS